MYGRIPPQAKEMENAILGAILLDKEAFDKANEILQADCFYQDRNQRIFKAATNLAKRNMPVDLLTVVEELRQTRELELVGGAYEVTKLTNSVVSSANIDAHSRIVMEKFIQRELIKIGTELISEAYRGETDVFEMLSGAERRISEIGSKRIQGDMVDINTVLVKTLTKIDEWRANESTLTGIPSGFDQLDRATRGWQPGDLIFIAARPSVGKTALALNMIRSAALGLKPTTVAVWSLEMRSIYLMLRMLSAESKIILHKIQTGRLDDAEMKHLYNKGSNILSKANIFFDDSSHVTIRTIKAKARRLKKKNSLGIIFIDYIQLMKSEESKGTRDLEVAGISRQLKELAMELDVPIIALSQLSRDGVKGVTWDIGPPTSAMRESGSLEQDADVILMLWGASDEELKKDFSLDGRRKVRIAKQRNGVLLTIELDFKNEIQLFEQITSF